MATMLGNSFALCCVELNPLLSNNKHSAWEQSISQFKSLSTELFSF